MSSGIELSTLGRLFTGVIQAVKGRLWSGVPPSIPTASAYPLTIVTSILERDTTLSIISRVVSSEVITRTARLEVIE